MNDYRLGAIETRFAQIIWDNEPLSSGELVKRCAETLSWKKSTTYTVLKKLCDRGLFQNEKGIVTSLLSREELHSRQSQQFMEETFQGSLPSFLAAFTARRKLTQEEIDQLQQLIDSQRGSSHD